MPKSKIVCLDFDGVLAHFTTWKGKDHIGKPNPQGVKLARMLRNAGVRVIIQTCRLNNEQPDIDLEGQLELITTWLAVHDVPYDELSLDHGKAYANCYVDDLGVHFPPNCNDCADAIYSQVLEMLYR